MFHDIASKLDRRKEENLFRSLTHTEGLADFVSNDYLGLARSKELFQLIDQKLKSLPVSNGATGSRLLSGNTRYIEEVEQKLAGIFQAERTLILNSGYVANLAVLSSLPQKDDTIIYDELCHASIKDGARLSLARRYPFKHNDITDLRKKLSGAKGKKYVVIETIYSMDGDEALVEEITKACEDNSATLIIDEAHSTGAYGTGGSGIAVMRCLHERIPVRIYTFGKAMGIHGACVTGSKLLIDYIVNFARPFIYTTALPLHSVASIDCGFDYLNQNSHLQQILQEKIGLYLSESSSIQTRIRTTNAIQSVIFPGNENARNAASYLQRNGFDVRPILSPTVRAGTERLRICLHVYNTSDEIRNLVYHLKELVNDK